MENTYEICYYGGMIAAIVLLIVTIVLFFVLKIPRVIGELTGLTARKGVKTIKEKGTKSDSTSEKEPRHYSQRTGAIKTRTADAVSGELSKKDNTTSGLIRGKSKKKSSFEDENKTGFLGEAKITAAVTGDIAETAVLSQNDVEDKEYEFVDTDNLKSEAGEKDALTETALEVAVTGADDDNTNEETAEVLNDADEEATEVLSDDDDKPTEVLADGDDSPTDVLSDGDEPAEVNSIGDDSPTEVLSDNSDKSTEVNTVGDDSPTEVLSDDNDDSPTEVLADDGEDEATEVLTSSYTDDEDATAVLTGEEEDFGETSVLSASVEKTNTKKYVVLYNALEIHTSESL